ncbi:MAG: TatD family hydrolase [Hydrogenothermaceae bacterium]
MIRKLVDTHCHLDMIDFDEVEESVREVNILLTVGCDEDEISKALNLGKKFENVYVAIGYHPYEADRIDENSIKSLENLLKSDKVVAVGEMGLDFYRNNASKENQYKYFLMQIDLAKKYNLPVIIHSREANRETQEIIKSENIDNGIMHCFGGDYNLLKTALDNGLYISFAGNVTYPKADNLREILRYVPLDRLLLETDSPYLSPQKVRGQKNKPSNIRYTYEFVSQFLNIDLEDLENVIYNNTLSLFKIKNREVVSR